MGVIHDGPAISTMFAVIALSTVCFGLVLLLRGVLKWGKYTQLIPYPVVGGFLAEVGMIDAERHYRISFRYHAGHREPPPAFLMGNDFAVAALRDRCLPFVLGMSRIRSVWLLPSGLFAFWSYFMP